MSHKQDLAATARPRTWTTPTDYIEALARQRTARRARRAKPRTQPEAPRLLLSTLPFLALLIALAVLSVAIFVVAAPGSAPPPKRSQLAQQEQGVAAKGWFQKAQREMH